MAAVSLYNVTKKFRDNRGREVRAADGISLDVKEGELLVLVGPSGCGKSTLLRLIAGLEVLDEGSVSIEDRDVSHIPPADRDVAMVFQNYALFPHLTVFENIAFGLKFRKVPKATIKRRVEEAAALLKLEDLLERKPAALSGGQRQRVALGRAIVRQPKVFLLDEPLSNLDAQLRGETRTELARLHQRLGATMILVTHDQTEAMTLGQRLSIMQEGRIIQMGTPMEVYEQPCNVFVAGFIGSPGMNIIRGIVHSGGRELLIAKPDVTEERLRFDVGPELAPMLSPYVGKDICLGVRPEHVLLTDDVVVRETWPAVVEVCETLGHECLLHVKRDGVSMTVRTSRATFTPGQTVNLQVPLSAWNLFDAVSGEMLVEQTSAVTV